MDKKYCPYCMSQITEGDKCPNCGLADGSYQPNPYHIPPGTVLKGRYLVGRVLGEGGFGITYIGCDLQLEMKVAIKEYYPQDRVQRTAEVSLTVNAYVGDLGKSYEKGKHKFLEEARVMAKLTKEPAIVRVQDFFEINNTAYIVMEYIEGTTLRELVEQKGGKIPPDELFPMVEPLFRAMQTMHEMGLLHRDISPDNIMIESGKVRLLDFGCAREAVNKNETLTIQLKHGYAPIEQYQQKGQGPWTDVYAFSATLYFCLTGRKPPGALDRIVSDELLRPSKLGVNLTEQQEKALLHGLKIQQNRRTQSMQELHSDLYNVAPVKPFDTGMLTIGTESLDGDADDLPELYITVEIKGENVDPDGMYGDIELRGGICETVLRPDNKLEIVGVPVGARYEVRCEDNDEFRVNGRRTDGKIEKDVSKSVAFECKRTKPKKQVTIPITQPIDYDEDPFDTPADESEFVPITEPVEEKKSEDVPKTEPVEEKKSEEVPKTEPVEEKKPEEVSKTEPVEEKKSEEISKTEPVEEKKPEEVPKTEPAKNDAKPSKKDKKKDKHKPEKPQRVEKADEVSKTEPAEVKADTADSESKNTPDKPDKKENGGSERQKHDKAEKHQKPDAKEKSEKQEISREKPRKKGKGGLIAAIISAVAVIAIAVGAVIALGHKSSLPKDATVLFEHKFEIQVAPNTQVDFLMRDTDEFNAFREACSRPGSIVFLDLDKSYNGVKVGLRANSVRIRSRIEATCRKNGETGYATDANGLFDSINGTELKPYAVDMFIMGEFDEQKVKGTLYVVEGTDGINYGKAKVISDGSTDNSKTSEPDANGIVAEEGRVLLYSFKQTVTPTVNKLQDTIVTLIDPKEYPEENQKIFELARLKNAKVTVRFDSSQINQFEVRAEADNGTAILNASRVGSEYSFDGPSELIHKTVNAKLNSPKLIVDASFDLTKEITAIIYVTVPEEDYIPLSDNMVASGTVGVDESNSCTLKAEAANGNWGDGYILRVFSTSAAIFPGHTNLIDGAYINDNPDNNQDIYEYRLDLNGVNEVIISVNSAAQVTWQVYQYIASENFNDGSQADDNNNNNEVGIPPIFMNCFVQNSNDWNWIGLYYDSLYVGETKEFDFFAEGKKVYNELSKDFESVDINNDPNFGMTGGFGINIGVEEKCYRDASADTARLKISISDIVITADGYDDVVIPAVTFDQNLGIIYTDEGWVTGNSIQISIIPEVKRQLGLNTKDFIQKYCTKMQGIKFTATVISLEMQNGESGEDIIAWKDDPREISRGSFRLSPGEWDEYNLADLIPEMKTDKTIGVELFCPDGGVIASYEYFNEPRSDVWDIYHYFMSSLDCQYMGLIVHDGHTPPIVSPRVYWRTIRLLDFDGLENNDMNVTVGYSQSSNICEGNMWLLDSIGEIRTGTVEEICNRYATIEAEYKVSSLYTQSGKKLDPDYIELVSVIACYKQGIYNWAYGDCTRCKVGDTVTQTWRDIKKILEPFIGKGYDVDIFTFISVPGSNYESVIMGIKDLKVTTVEANKSFTEPETYWAWWEYRGVLMLNYSDKMGNQYVPIGNFSNGDISWYAGFNGPGSASSNLKFTYTDLNSGRDFVFSDANLSDNYTKLPNFYIDGNNICGGSSTYYREDLSKDDVIKYINPKDYYIEAKVKVGPIVLKADGYDDISFGFTINYKCGNWNEWEDWVGNPQTLDITKQVHDALADAGITVEEFYNNYYPNLRKIDVNIETLSCKVVPR